MKKVDKSKRYLYHGYIIEYAWEFGDWVIYPKGQYVGALPTFRTKAEAKEQVRRLT